jgi:3-oxoacyl-ACP reductase-like protein
MTESSQPPGPGIDAQGRTVVDPTDNVRSLIKSAVSRQDDLRKAEHDHLREVIQLRAEMDLIRDGHTKELRDAESKRIDAIRAVDVGAVAAAAQVAATQAAALASQVAVSADAMRNQVAAVAQQAAAGLAAALDPMSKDIAELRRSQYESLGAKSQTVDTRAVYALAITVIMAALALFLAFHK